MEWKKGVFGLSNYNFLNFFNADVCSFGYTNKTANFISYKILS